MFYIGESAYIIESNRKIRGGTIVRVKKRMCLFGFNEGGGLWVRESRLYHTQEEADATIAHPESNRNSPARMAALRNHIAALGKVFIL